MIVCPRCGTRNPEGARFCFNCGSALASVTTGEERKLITVLFCDLVGFTERSDHADPEDVKATLRVYHTLLKRVIDRYGGTIDKFIGDAVLGVFGAPVGHEDDPERAVHAALRILDEVAEANLDHPGLDLAVRIGVNTGEAVVTFGEGPQIGEAITGDVVNTASRLQSIAPTNGIVVGAATYHATPTVFKYEALPPATVKGKAEPLEIWRPIHARARVGVDVRERPRTAFVGRSDELTTLRQAWRVVRGLRGTPRGPGAAQMVTVTGEPGVGKSRLIREFSAYLDELPDLIRFRQGRCLPYGEGVGFWAFGEIVKAQAGIQDSDGPEEAEAKLTTELERFIENDEERDWVRARMMPLIGTGSPAADVPREELFAAWRRFVEALAENGPLVMVFEDLHWADASMLDLIENLVDGSRVSFLVVCAGRPELYERAPGWGDARPNAVTLALSPLTQTETALLLSSLLERAVLPAETQALLIDRSGGNPLFAEEFVQLLSDRGTIDRADRERSIGIVEDIPIPESLLGLIGSRLDALAWETKVVLQDAAVVGKVFWAGALAAIGGSPQAEVLAHLEDASRRELVRPQQVSSLKGELEYSFWHALIRDVAYGQIPRAARGDRHVAAARWLRGAVPERLSDVAEELAYHYAEALALAEATGADAGDVRAEAGEAALLAGERAAPLDAVRADGYFRSALSLMAADDPGRPRAAARAGEIAEARGNFAESEQLFLAAITGYRVTGNLSGLGEAMGLLARLYGRRGEAERSERVMEEAIATLEAQPPSPELARIYIRRAGDLLGQEQDEASLGFAEKGLELAEQLGLDDQVVRALQFRGAARCELGDDERGLADLREAIRLGLEAGLGQAVALAYGNYAYQLWFRQGPAAAIEVWREMERVASARGFETQVQQARMGMLETLFDMGDWDQVLETCHEMQRWVLPADRKTEIAVYAKMFEAWVRLRRGETTSLAPFAEELLESASPFPQAEYVAPALLVAAETRAATGDLAGAREALDRFAKRTEAAPNYRALFVPVAVRSLVRLGDVDAAEALIPEHSVARTERHRASILTARAVVAEARGECEEALDGYRQVAELWSGYGFRLELGLTRIGQARCLLKLGRTEEARSRLLEAREVMSPLGARPALDEADELLGDRAAEVG